MRALLATMTVLLPLSLAACSGGDGDTRFAIALPNLNAQSAAAVNAVALPDSSAAVCPGRSTC